MATKICKLDAVESPPAHQPSAVNFGSRIHGIQIPTLWEVLGTRERTAEMCYLEMEFSRLLAGQTDGKFVLQTAGIQVWQQRLAWQLI